MTPSELERWQPTDPELQVRLEVVTLCEKSGARFEAAVLFAGRVHRAVSEYRAFQSVDRIAGKHKDIALIIHTNAKRALKLLDRRTFRPREIDACIADVARSVQELHQMGSGSSPYVSPVMRFGITDETVRWATGRMPGPCRACINPREMCRCRFWPEGSPCDVDAFDVFELVTPARPRDLDPRNYALARRVGLLRLFRERFSPSRTPSAPRQGRPAMVAKQTLMDTICHEYELKLDGRAAHDNTGWMNLATSIVEVYGLEIAIGYRVKQFEALRTKQRRSFGGMRLPRGIGVPPMTDPSGRGRWLEVQRKKRLLDIELFVGGDTWPPG